MSRAPDWDAFPMGAGYGLVWRHPDTNMRWLFLDPKPVPRATAHALVVLLTFGWLTIQ